MSPRELGQRAELAVADYLFVRGFEVLARNVRLGALEIDLVARKGPLAVVVEVRARRPGAWVGPFQSIGPTKRMRLLRAAERLWSRDLAHVEGLDRLRIDAAAVTVDAGRTAVDYVEGALSG